jgi:Mg-chelatase subunit ChlD
LQEQVQRLHQMLGGLTNLTDGLRVAIQMASQSPIGTHRRIWLLSDGYPNVDTDQVMNVAAQAYRHWVNVNTIGFGDEYDAALLRRISEATHNGRFVPVHTLRELTAALVGNGRRRHHCRTETTILAIDLSGSMAGPMEGRRKIEVVQEAILHLLRYKQVCFS